MPLSVGRLRAVGIKKEATRGTAETSAIEYIHRMDGFEWDDVPEVQNDESGEARMEAYSAAQNVKYTGQGTLPVIARAKVIGHLLLAAFGTVTTAANTPSSGAHQHTFSVSQNPVTPSYTVIDADPNNPTVYKNAVLNTLNITGNATTSPSLSATYMSHKGSPITLPTNTDVTPEQFFTPKTLIAKYANTVAGLASAANLPIRSIDLTIDRGIVPDNRIGMDTPNDFISTHFMASGTIEINVDDSNFRTQMLANTQGALRVEMELSNKQKLTLTFYKVHINAYTRSSSNSDIITASVEIMGLYDGTSTVKKLMDAVLINSKTSY